MVRNSCRLISLHFLRKLGIFNNFLSHTHHNKIALWRESIIAYWMWLDVLYSNLMYPWDFEGIAFRHPTIWLIDFLAHDKPWHSLLLLVSQATELHPPSSFGYLCYSKINEHMTKFAPRVVRAILLGYSTKSKGYKSNLKTCAIFVNKDIAFHEHTFPFGSTPRIQWYDLFLTIESSHNTSPHNSTTSPSTKFLSPSLVHTIGHDTPSPSYTSDNIPFDGQIDDVPSSEPS